MIDIFKNAINDFIVPFNRLENKVGKPVLIERSGILQFRYMNNDVETLCLIKSGRIISSLNAILVLLEYGFIVEIGMLVRSIKECSAEVSFLLENYPEKPMSNPQKQYLDEFFKEEFGDATNPIDTIRDHKRVSLKKVHAGYARNINELSKKIENEELRNKLYKISNPSSHQKATISILNVFSGYIHFGYVQSMEIIGDTPPRYHLNGLSGTPKNFEWEDIIIGEIYAIYNHFRFMCLKFNFSKEFEIIGKKQKEFQLSTDHNPQI